MGFLTSLLQLDFNPLLGSRENREKGKVEENIFPVFGSATKSGKKEKEVENGQKMTVSPTTEIFHPKLGKKMRGKRQLL